MKRTTALLLAGPTAAALSSAPTDIAADTLGEHKVPPMARPLDQAAHDVYREPFLEESSRKQVNQWPNEMPIGRVPQETHDIVSAYNFWLETTETPWLFLYASPGALNPPAAAGYWTARAQNIETADIGAGLHYVQEDQPYAIGRASSDWYRRLEAGK